MQTACLMSVDRTTERTNPVTQILTQCVHEAGLAACKCSSGMNAGILLSSDAALWVSGLQVMVLRLLTPGRHAYKIHWLTKKGLTTLPSTRLMSAPRTLECLSPQRLPVHAHYRMHGVCMALHTHTRVVEPSARQSRSKSYRPLRASALLELICSSI